MKNFRTLCRALGSFLSLALFLSSCTLYGGQQEPVSSESEDFPVSEFPAANVPITGHNASGSSDTMRGVWISYLEFDHMLSGKSEDSYRTEITEMVQNCKKKELNTLIVQVRSHGDAYYPSELYPWSSHASGTVGKACDFDPFKILIELSRKEGLSVHAWINPYRLMKDEEMEQVSDAFLIKKWYQNNDFMSQGKDGYWYLNAGNSDVQELIVQGVQELIENYEIDGIQIDDYFYDKVKPSDFGQNEEQGRKNVTDMVKQIYTCVKKKDENLLFGISPAGNYGNQPASDQSQLTNLSLWCTEEGYLDYIAPQIYWEFDHEEAPFLTVLEKWEKLVEDSPVKLYVGLAAYKFADTDILQQEIDEVNQRENSEGYILFRYDNLV